MDEKCDKGFNISEKENVSHTNSLESVTLSGRTDYASQKSADESASAGELNSNEKLLLAECWRHLLLGQWECFRALFLTFIEETKDKMGIDSAQILLKIFESPELFCKGSMHMKKPQDIFWLCAQLYKEIYGENDNFAKKLEFEAAFRYIISDVIDIFPQSQCTVKELYNIFNNYQVKTWNAPPILSEDGIFFLTNVLKKEPVLGINFLKHLIQAELGIHSNNYGSLLRCYYEALSQLLAIFEVGINRFHSCQDDLEEDTKDFCILFQEFELFSTFYCDNVTMKEAFLLDGGESALIKFREDIDKLILRIWEICERGVLDRTVIYFSIMSFQQSDLIRRFFYFENESKNRIIQPNLTVSAENVLRLIHDKEGRLNIKELCLYAIVNKVHFLECILLNCVHLICCGEYILTCRFLQDSVLCRLKPLVFLLAWSKIKSIPEVSDLCELYKLLYSDFTYFTDPYLNSICEQLVWKGNLLRWSLTKSTNMHKNKDKKIRSAVDVLKNLYKLSDLTIVHQCIYLEEVDRQELVSILEGKALEQKLSNDENELEGLTLQQIRDKMVLQSFYILNDASYIVLNGTKLEQMLMHTNFVVIYEDIREFYRTCVIEPLRKIKDETHKLLPITYRVEILENLYSLLFLTHSNIAENSSDLNSSMDDSDENFENKEKSSDSKDCDRKTSKKKSKRMSSREEINFASFNFHDFKSKLPFVGFLMNDLVIRDMLDFLKTSLQDTQAAWHRTQKNQELEILENKLQSKLISSITSETLQKHLTRLLQFVNEALWRFYLVAGDWIPKEIGIFPSIDMIKNRKVKIVNPVNLYGESSEDEDGIDLKKVCNFENMNEPLNKKDQIGKSLPRRSQRKKSFQKTAIKFINSKSLVHKMLASHESLLNYCLNENLPLKAQQVIKMAGMENTLKALEVDFAMGYEKILVKLQKVTSPSDLKAQSLDNRTVEIESNASKNVSAWDSIMRAASSARGTLADETVIVDELLAKFQVPFINEVNIFGLKPILIEWLPEQIDWRALVRADLALVGCSSMIAAQNLLQSAYLSFRNSESPKTTRRSKSKDRKRQGIASFIREVLSILTKLYSEEKFVNNNELIGDGIRGLLLQGLRSFSYKSHKKMKDSFTQFNLCVSILFNLLDSEKSLLVGPTNNLEIFLKCPSEISSILNLPSSKLNSIDVHLIYNRLIKSITAVRNQLLEDRLFRGEVKRSDVPERGPAYLFTFYEYVSYLNTVLPSLEDDSSEIRGFFSILRYSPATIFEKLLFERKILPLSLEKVAVRLNANLVRIIIEYCCPYIPVKLLVGYENQNVQFEYCNRPKEWKPISFNLLNYIEDKCWILAVIIRAMTATTKSYSDSESSESSQCDCAILYPVLHRYLDKRLVGNVNYGLEWFALCSQISVDIIKPILQKFVEVERWIDVLNFLNRWECQLYIEDDNLTTLKDEMLIKLTLLMDSKSYSFAMQIENMEKRVLTVKENYLKWSSKIAICALNSCIGFIQTDDEISQLINQVKVCELIARQFSLIGDEQYFWQEVHCLLMTSESIVLNQLFDLKKYDLIKKCSKFYSLNDDSQKVVSDSLVLALIHVPVIDQSTLCQALESCNDVSQRFSICFKILEHICDQTVNAFSLLSILEGETFEGILIDDLKAFIKNKIGVKIYLALKEEERKNYFHLVKYPHILIEQLLIDIKIETLKHAFEEIREDLKFLSDDSTLSFNALNNILKIYAGKAVDFRVAQTIMEVNTGNSKTKMEPKDFVFPGYLHTKNQWIPDSATSECMICTVERFSMFNRRHHCRKCGKLVCSSCSQNKAIVNGYGDVVVRVCDPCFGNKTGVEINFYVPKDQDSLEKQPTDNSASEGPPGLLDADLDTTNYFSAKLSINEIHNLTVREEFSYEQAPNIPLYLLIYDLCWDPHESAKEHIKLAKTLLKFLQPISNGQPNQEVDYNLIINMVKSVLLNAKVKFSKTFDNAGVTSADHYLGLTDLFKLLVSANCKHLIPLGDLNQRETIRKLCDVLIKEERWNLALEVSTKGGFDNFGVWAAWGMVCLRAGYFTAAREKFLRCLKPLNKSSKTTLQNCSLLMQILEYLETLNVDNDITVIAASLARLKNIRTGNLQSITPVFSDGKLNSKIMSECLFYLQTYGNHGMTITFYVNNNDWYAALKYVVDHKISTATFVEEILTASIKKGAFKGLLDKLLAFDVTLDTWSNYLLASCRFLQNGGCHLILYELQLFLKDYTRAAMTCINLYQSGAKNYVDLHDRLPHLKQAKHMLQTYCKGYDDSVSKKSTTEHILILKDEDLKKYIKSIDMQIEITQFLFERVDQWQSVKRSSFDSLSNSSIMSTSRSIETEILTDKPTVFGNSKSRAHLFVMIVMSGHTIEEGFNIANRLLTVYQLNAINVYSLLVKKLVQNDRLADILKVIICMKTMGNVDNNFSDKVILTAIPVAITYGHVGKDFDPLMKCLVDDHNKVEAFIMCGKLKSAYLLAVKEDKIDSVQRIFDEAERTGQTSVKDLCKKWLAQKKSD